ncbi:hypothetical protein SAFG77S_04516 [Streptomyces afghaniensis]
MGGARPEGADVPQDADGAAGRGVLVRAPAPGDEQYEAEADQPGAEGLGGLGGAVDDGVGALRRLARRLVGGQGAHQGAGAEQQGDAGGDGDDAGSPVGEGGHRAGVGDTAGAGAVLGVSSG